MWPALRRSAAFWFGLTFVIAAAGMIPVVLNEKSTYEALLAKGQSTEAAVIDSGELKNADDRSTHWLKLQYYDLSLKEYVKEQSVPEPVWRMHPVGSTIAIRYLRENPEKVKLEVKLPEPEWKDLLAITITFLAIGLAIVTLATIKANRRASGRDFQRRNAVPTPSAGR